MQRMRVFFAFATVRTLRMFYADKSQASEIPVPGKKMGA